MNNKELHNIIEALDVPMPSTLQYQQRLKRAVFKESAKKQSLTSRIRGSLVNFGEVVMRQNKKTLGMGSFAAVVVMALSIVGYSYRFSPKAVADQLVDQSIESLQLAPADKLATIQANFGTDPKKALEEAKEAKDLKVITKQEYEAESKKSPGVFATTLGDSNGPSFSTMSISAPDGGTTMGAVSSSGVHIMGSGEGGVTSSGTVNFVEGVPSTAASVAPVPVSGEGGVIVRGEAMAAGGAAGSGPVTMHYEAGAALGQNMTSNTNFTMATPAGGVVGSQSAELMPGTAGTVVTPTLTNFQPIKLEEPSKYLRYTDKNNRVVVLSLDAQGLPIFKTVFMSAKDMPRP